MPEWSTATPVTRLFRALGRGSKAPLAAVVATDHATVNADCDNGAGPQCMRGSRRSDEPADGWLGDGQDLEETEARVAQIDHLRLWQLLVSMTCCVEGMRIAYLSTVNRPTGLQPVKSTPG